MKRRTISCEFTVFDSLGELNAKDLGLMQKAIEAREDAYAPYSNFMVGAAVLLDNGAMVIGNNQENASYPSGLCAERVAVFQAGAKYPGTFLKAIAIAAKSNTHLVDKPAAPCENCRQSILEYEFKQNSPIALLFMGETGDIIKCRSLADMLPLSFNNSYL